MLCISVAICQCVGSSLGGFAIYLLSLGDKWPRAMFVKKKGRDVAEGVLDKKKNWNELLGGFR